MGTWEWDIPTGYVSFNERWASMLGYHLDEIEPHLRTWEQLVHPDDLQPVMALVTAHLRGETPAYSSEYRLRHKSGTWCWVFDSGRVVERDATGAPLRAAGIHLDLSARKELEAAQTRSQDELMTKQQALDEVQTLAHLGSWDWDIATDTVQWSDEQCRIFGLAPGRISPTYATFLATLHPDDADRVRQAVEAALTQDIPYNIDCRILRPNSEVRHINCRGVVHRDRDGQPVSMTGTVLDITDYTRAEHAWRDTETRMRSIFESAIEGILVIDERGRIECANTALLNLLGYQEQELIGKNISMIMPSPYREHHDQYLANYLLTGKQVIIGSGREVPAQHKNGSLLDLHVSVSEMQIGTEKKYTGMLRDISERKRMEATLRESEERFRQLAEHIDAFFGSPRTIKADSSTSAPPSRPSGNAPGNISMRIRRSGSITSIRKTAYVSALRPPVKLTCPTTRSIELSHRAGECAGSGIAALPLEIRKEKPTELRESPRTLPIPNRWRIISAPASDATDHSWNYHPTPYSLIVKGKLYLRTPLV